MSSEAEGQKSCHSLRELSLSGSTSPPQTRQCSGRAQATASLISGEFLVSPLILAEHESLRFIRLHGMGSRPPTSIHDSFLSLTGTILASCPAQGAIVCRAVCNQAMLEPALGWVEHVPGTRSMQTSYSSRPYFLRTFCRLSIDGQGGREWF